MKRPATALGTDRIVEELGKEDTVMSNDQQDTKKLRTDIERIISDIDVAEHEANDEEIIDEIKDELKRDLGLSKVKVSKLGQKLPMPTSQGIVSYDSGGKTVLSRVEDDEWRFLEVCIYKTHNFRHQSEGLGLDLTGELSDLLVNFSKVCAWFMLPGNNPGSGVKNTRTSRNNMDYFRYFLALLINKGFLLNIANVEPKPLSMLNVD